MVHRPPIAPLSPARAPERYCRFCEQATAVALDDELGVMGKYKLFCTTEHAALFGIMTALEREKSI